MPDDTVVERFVGYLRQQNLPVTAQRLAIAEVLLASDRHLSAEEVAGELSKRGQKVGTATVYRAIDTLLESGLLVERDFGEGFRRFEPARYTSGVAVGAVLAGCALAMRPDFLPGELRFDEAAAGDPTLVATLVALVLALLVIVPSIAWLFRLTLAGRLADRFPPPPPPS